MNRIRKAGKRDANEKEIIEELERLGALVIQLDQPVDLLVGWRGCWYPVEIKAGPDSPITKGQSTFFQAAGRHDLDSFIFDHIDDCLGLLKVGERLYQPADQAPSAEPCALPSS